MEISEEIFSRCDINNSNAVSKLNTPKSCSVSRYSVQS